MARVCELSKKGVMVGNRVSHAKNRTKVRLLPNLQHKRLYIPSLKRFVSIRLCTQALKTVNKIGIEAYLKRAGIKVS